MPHLVHTLQRETGTLFVDSPRIAVDSRSMSKTVGLIASLHLNLFASLDRCRQKRWLGLRPSTMRRSSFFNNGRLSSLLVS